MQGWRVVVFSRVAELMILVWFTVNAVFRRMEAFHLVHCECSVQENGCFPLGSLRMQSSGEWMLSTWFTANAVFRRMDALHLVRCECSVQENGSFPLGSLWMQWALLLGLKAKSYMDVQLFTITFYESVMRENNYFDTCLTDSSSPQKDLKIESQNRMGARKL